MNNSRFWRCVGLGLAAIWPWNAIGAEPTSGQIKQGKAPAASPSPTQGSARSDAPAELLKSRNLRRSGTSYLLGTETQVQRKLAGARTQLAQFRQAAARQQAFEFGIRDRKAFEEQMIQQRLYYNQQLAEVDRQMPSLDVARTNEAVNLARNDLVDQHNRLVALINEANDRIRLINNQGDDSELKQRVATEVAGYREAYLQTILDIRQLIDETRKSYEDLSKDPEVAAALKSINDTSKAKYKLGPSKEFLSNVAAFEKVEATVLTETVELRKHSGVYWVDVTFNGKITRPMVFDTGAGISTLSSSLAAEIGLKPKSSDPTIKCQTADGSIVEAKQLTVGSMRVGKFTVRNIVCAVMPPEKGDVDPLLGQSFQRHFTFKFTPQLGRLTLTQVDEGDATTRSTTPTKRGRTATKGKRSSRSQVRGGDDLPMEIDP